MSIIFVIDSGEKSYVFEAFDKMGISYRKEEIKFFFCSICNKIYKDKREKCECDGEIESVRVGDITNEERSFLIERKKGEDLYSSLDGRIYEQMEKLSGILSGNIAIVYEGDLFKLALDHPDRSGQILSIPATAMQYNVSFITVKSIVQLIKLLKYFDYKSKTPPKLRLKRRFITDLMPKRMVVLLGIKGVGEKMALELSKRYKSVTDVGVALRNGRLVAGMIPKLGPVGIKRLKEWLN